MLNLNEDDANFTKLDESTQKLYVKVEGGEGGYKLNVNGLPDTDALLNAKNHEKTLRKKAQTDYADLQTKYDDEKHENAKKNGSIDDLDNSWKRKTSDTEKLHSKELLGKDKTILNLTVGAEADKIMSASNVLPKFKKYVRNDIMDRLTGVTNDDGDIVVKVLGTDGKVSAQTIDEFQLEFAGNKENSHIISGTKANGSSTDHTKLKSIRFSDSDSNKTTDLSSLKPKELAARIKASKQQT